MFSPIPAEAPGQAIEKSKAPQTAPPKTTATPSPAKEAAADEKAGKPAVRRVTISGRVLDEPGGKGQGDIRVTLQTFTGFGVSTMFTKTATDGSYSMAVGAADFKQPMFLFIDRGSRRPGAVEPGLPFDVADQDFAAKDLYLRLPQSISGTVRDAQTGKPVAGARIELAQDNSIRWPTTRADTGSTCRRAHSP